MRKRAAGAFVLVILVLALGLMTCGISWADGEPDIRVSAEPIYVKGSGNGYTVRLMGPENFDAELQSWSFSACPAERPDLEYFVNGDYGSFRNPIVLPEKAMESIGRWTGSVTLQYDGYDPLTDEFEFLVTKPETTDMTIHVFLTKKNGSIPKVVIPGQEYLLTVEGDSRVRTLCISYTGIESRGSDTHKRGSQHAETFRIKDGNWGVAVSGTTSDPWTEEGFAEWTYRWDNLNWSAFGNPLGSNVMDITPDLNLPAGTVLIEDEAFAGVRNLIVRIPDGVTSIADSAFDSSVVILCSEDSYAKTWAEKNGIAVIVER